jgi:hypothetical protein
MFKFIISALAGKNFFIGCSILDSISALESREQKVGSKLKKEI